MKILIVDDHPMLAAGLMSTLRQEIPDYMYEACTNLTDAKRILFGKEAQPVSLVICDLGLGAENGPRPPPGQAHVAELPALARHELEARSARFKNGSLDAPLHATT